MILKEKRRPGRPRMYSAGSKKYFIKLEPAMAARFEAMAERNKRTHVAELMCALEAWMASQRRRQVREETASSDP